MLYVDSADLRQITRLLATGLFDGVTCNPSILAAAGRGFGDLPALYSAATGAGAHLFFAQSTGTAPEALEASARKVIALGERARLKIMATGIGLTVARRLVDEGNEVLVTGVTHPAQVLAARAAGASWVAAYVSRAARAGIPPERLVGESVAAMNAVGAGRHLRIIAASLHTLDQIAVAAALGAGTSPCPSTCATPCWTIRQPWPPR